MKVKEGVVLAGLDIKMRPVLIAAEKIWSNYGQELVVTCGLNGEHSAGSYHYYGLALDFRHRYFTDIQKDMVAEELMDKLRRVENCQVFHDYDVVIENTHIHVEYDS